MERQLSIGEAREQFTRLADQFEREREAHVNPEPITVTRHGKPVFTIVPQELYEAIIETLEVMGDEELMVALRQGIKEAEQGKGRPWERLKL